MPILQWATRMTGGLRRTAVGWGAAALCGSASASGPGIAVNINLTLITASGVCGSAGGSGSISVACVAPQPGVGGPTGAGGNTGVSVTPVVPVTPGIPLGPAVPVVPGAIGGNVVIGGAGGVVPPLPSGPRSFETQLTTYPLLESLLSSGPNWSIPAALRRVMLSPPLVLGSAPISFYSHRADITGFRTVSMDNGEYVEITISW